MNEIDHVQYTLNFKNNSGQIYLNNIIGKHDIKELQKTAILGTAHVFQKVLMWQYKTFVKGHNITCTIYCNHRIAATLYTLETWFVSGI
jgi:hypothetical protein